MKVKMTTAKTICCSFLAMLLLSACAPRAIVKPAPTVIPAANKAITGLRASVRVTVQQAGKSDRSFDAVLRAARPGKVRVSGLALLGVTVFDVVLDGDKFWFYQPSEGYLYTGTYNSLRGLLKEKGIDIDPAVIYKALFLELTGEGNGIPGPDITVQSEGQVVEGDYVLPLILIAHDEKAGYTITVNFEKYIVNPPEGMDKDFTIEGGELKGIRTVE